MEETVVPRSRVIAGVVKKQFGVVPELYLRGFAQSADPLFVLEARGVAATQGLAKILFKFGVFCSFPKIHAVRRV